jgi:hypothetical protein
MRWTAFIPTFLDLSMNAFARAAAVAAVFLAALAAPAAAQSSATPLAAPSWDERLTPAAAAPAREARLSSAELSPRVKGAGLLMMGVGLMYVTKKAEGEDGEDGVPFIPLLSGTVGALSFWYGALMLYTGQ